MVDDSSHLPRWLEVLLGEKFFNACLIHEEAKKNEKNIFCLDCCESICPHCLSPHRSHRLLQIRRYVYQDVIRVSDAEKLMDCSYVQSYTTNSAKVVFLNQRPQTRPFRGAGNFCITCERALQEQYLFCSLSCKLQNILRTAGTVSKYVFECEQLTLPELGLDDGQMTPDSVLEPGGSLRTSSGSSGSGGGVDCRTIRCTAATTEVVRKKRSSVAGFRAVAAASCRPVCSPTPEIVAAGRRKGTPHRSPLY
ncbi:hypothetical protein NMG60_11023047 [Bertholletia excelsa]